MIEKFSNECLRLPTAFVFAGLSAFIYPFALIFPATIQSRDFAAVSNFVGMLAELADFTQRYTDKVLHL